MSKGMSIDDCIIEADKLIRKNGACLFAFDVVNSRNFPDYNSRQELQDDLSKMLHELSSVFEKYFPVNTLASCAYEEKGFYRQGVSTPLLLGDASWTGINSSEVISKIVQYQKQFYDKIKFNYSVGEDGFDERIRKIVF